jgi:hypothetical protein
MTLTGLSPAASAFVLNMAALLATALLCFAIGRKAAHGSAIAGVTAAAATLLSSEILTVHAMIWSEPLFIALTLGAILGIVHATDSDDFTSLIAAALLAGLAGLVRYAAPSVIATGGLSLLLLGSSPLRRRLLRSVTFGGLASLPLAVFLAVNAMRETAATPRQAAFHPPDLHDLRIAMGTAYHWVMPERAPAAVEAALAVALAAAGVALVVAIVRSPGTAMIRALPAVRRRAIQVLALFCVCYVAFLTLVMTVFDAQTTLGARLLTPLVPAVTILVVSFLAAGVTIDQWRGPSIAMSVVLSMAMLAGAATWLLRTRHEGLEYSGPEWRGSPLIVAVRGMPHGTVVYSNHPAGILHQTGREVLGIPRHTNPNSGLTDATFEARMDAICRMAALRDVAYVHFAKPDSERFLPSLAEARRQWQSQPLLVASDGVIDTIPAACAEDLQARPDVSP